MNDIAPPPAEIELVERLAESEVNGERVTLVVGSGLGDPAAPRVADVIQLADRYAHGRNDDGDLQEALLQARAACAEDTPAALFEEYQRVLADWLSADEFDAIAQQSVLQRYQPQDLLSTALGSHGLWQPITLRLGEEIENDIYSWELSRSVRALGALLARRSDLFGSRVLTTNIDPALEIAIRRAGGKAITTIVGDAPVPPASSGDQPITVHHLHGFWRPLLSNTPGRLTQHIDPAAATRIGEGIAPLLAVDLVCVLGSGDRSGTVRAAVASADRRPQVIWASHSEDAPAPDVPRARLRHLRPVDNARLLPDLARHFAVAVPSRPTQTAKVRHPAWERVFVSQPDNEPPARVPILLRELERRFAWRIDWGDGAPDDDAPLLVYWPVRLRRRTSVIHMVQAFAAGALAARGARVVVSLDDMSVTDSAGIRGPFVADLRRWITTVAPDAEPRFTSLLEYVEETARSTSSDGLLRPTDPWSVARDFYGRSMSLYTALAAVKALPHLAPFELDANAAKIVQDLQRHNSSRVLTPMTMWAYLQSLLLDNPSSSLITLGGRDEGLFWEQWRQVYGLGISQLYNPNIKSLNHESGMVRWDAADELARQLHALRELPNPEDEGRYPHWLFQNAVLLPAYLTHQEPPQVNGHLIDSWAAFSSALSSGLPVLEMLATRAHELFTGQN
ncbi:hypothetical protein ACQPZJ_15615 [Actinoplanes sp. CA-054009]